MKKQIYITALHLAHGGVEMAISLMSNAFVKKGYAVTILSLYALGEPAYPISPDVKIEYLTDVKPNKEEFMAALGSKNPFRILREGLYAIKVLRLKKTALVKRIKQIRDGIIISTRNEHSVLLSKYAGEGVMKIAQLHHDHCFDEKLFSAFKNSYGNIDFFTLLTDELTKEVSELMAPTNRKTRCVTMENFLEDGDFNVELEKKEKTVLAVGRLHEVKGFDRLLKIWKEAVQKCPDWRLIIVGDGGEEEKLRALSETLGVSNSVTFTGALDHDKVLETMKAASLYTMTSYSEGFPFVLIEAMSCGLPSVAFDVRVGPRAIIKDGVNGLLVEDNDAQAFCDALCGLMKDDAKRLGFSKNAIERAKDFTEEKIVGKWLGIFEN